MNKLTENLKKVTGPTANHTHYGEIFALRPGEVDGEVKVITPNRFWFVGKEIRVFAHKKESYWYNV